MRFRLILFMLLWSVCICAQESLPCMGTTTTRLNVRSGPGKQYARKDLLVQGKSVIVLEQAGGSWVLVKYGNKRGYVHSAYLRFTPMPVEKKQEKVEEMQVPDVVWKIGKWGLSALGIYILMILSLRFLVRVLSLAMRIIKHLSMWYYLLNWLQRFLHKPWYLLLKKNRFGDETNKTLRMVTMVIKIPLYVACTPLRLMNAIFYNLLIHCSFEMLNYTMEVLHPSTEEEGEDSPYALHLFLWRIIKYPIWHGMLVFIESLVWTAIDTLLPALTLYHGTDATCDIVSSPNRHSEELENVGLWLVGSGNYAGNGIYFASAYSTSAHYSRGGCIIVCRVTLGRVLDLGLAPNYVYNRCGHADATVATRWGLEYGYTTGEWWRPDERWWEFCMYDWQNRYNDSWRIRPLYTIDVCDREVFRICGGMHHWLFRKLVIKDMCNSILNL